VLRTVVRFVFWGSVFVGGCLLVDVVGRWLIQTF
jgi:hypothetical protein